MVCSLGFDAHGGCLSTPNSVIVHQSHNLTQAPPTPNPLLVLSMGNCKHITSYSEANMPTSCSIIPTPLYSNGGDNSAMSSDSSIPDTLLRVSAVLVSMNSLKQWFR
jgi:hypothetical protein